VADLNIRTDVIGVPTVREDDGVALSSRNAYLTDTERAKAPALYAAISAAAAAIAGGGDVNMAVEAAKTHILLAGFDGIDYVAARHAETLAPLKNAQEPGRVLAATRLGRARLIDNVAIGTK
jgi:pantoate--beta-alanine ligase